MAGWQIGGKEAEISQSMLDLNWNINFAICIPEQELKILKKALRGAERDKVKRIEWV